MKKSNKEKEVLSLAVTELKAPQLDDVSGGGAYAINVSATYSYGYQGLNAAGFLRVRGPVPGGTGF